MALTPEDQEQLDSLKEWWKENALWLFLGAGLAVGGIGIYKGWDYWQLSHANAAAEHYQEYRTHLAEDRSEQAREAAERLRDHYGTTSYASMASLLAARVAFEAGDLEEVRQQLRWVHENGDDPILSSIATLRLARVHIAVSEWEQGLELLEDFNMEGMEGLLHELRGDLLHGAGRTEEALQEYAQAVEKGQASEFLLMKQMDRGGFYAEF